MPSDRPRPVPTGHNARRVRHAAGPEVSNKRQEILDIAERMFAERGFRGTSMRDIAEAADVLSGSLYHHVSSKDEIVDEIITEYWADVFDRLSVVDIERDSSADRLTFLIEESLALVAKHEYPVRIMLNDWHYLVSMQPYLAEHMSVVEGIWTRVLRDGVKEGYLRTNVNPLLVYRTIMSSISGTARWFRSQGSISIGQLSATMTVLFLQGAIAPTGDDGYRHHLLPGPVAKTAESN